MSPPYLFTNKDHRFLPSLDHCSFSELLSRKRTPDPLSILSIAFLIKAPGVPSGTLSPSRGTGRFSAHLFAFHHAALREACYWREMYERISDGDPAGRNRVRGGRKNQLATNEQGDHANLAVAYTF